MDALALTDLFRFSHMLVVAIGLGAAFLADFHVLSRITRRVDDELLATLHACHSLVWYTLILMWVTGAIMVYVRTGFHFGNFTPKLFSKLLTVSILTFNAVMIGRHAMPILEETRGKSILVLPLADKLTLGAVASISTVSWLLSLAMGVSKVLAASGWLVFMSVLPLAYVASALLAATVMYLIHLGVTVGARSVRIVMTERPQTEAALRNRARETVIAERPVEATRPLITS